MKLVLLFTLLLFQQVLSIPRGKNCTTIEYGLRGLPHEEGAVKYCTLYAYDRCPRGYIIRNITEGPIECRNDVIARYLPERD